jgi:hypothetical protein
MKSPLIHLILALLVCIAALIGYGVWYATIVDMSTSVATLQNQIDTKIEAVSRVTTTQAALAGIAGDEAVVQSYFVPETGVVAFIDDLEARGHSQGTTVSVLSVSTGGVPAQPTLVFSLSVKGTFDAVMRTVGAIEYAPYAISISALSVGQDDKNSWYANLKLLVGSSATSTATRTP